jgi:hypothetical protein
MHGFYCYDHYTQQGKNYFFKQQHKVLMAKNELLNILVLPEN